MSERRFFMATIASDGSFDDWFGPLTLEALEGEIDFWRSDKTNETIAAVVTESLVHPRSGERRFTNVQVYDKDPAQEVSDDAIVWTWQA